MITCSRVLALLFTLVMMACSYVLVAIACCYALVLSIIICSHAIVVAFSVCCRVIAYSRGLVIIICSCVIGSDSSYGPSCNV